MWGFMEQALVKLRQMVDEGLSPHEVAQETGLALEVVELYASSPLSAVGRELRLKWNQKN